MADVEMEETGGVSLGSSLVSSDPTARRAGNEDADMVEATEAMTKDTSELAPTSRTDAQTAEDAASSMSTSKPQRLYFPPSPPSPLPKLTTTIHRPVTVTKPIPYTFDLGNLLATDANPLPPNPSNDTLTETARDCVQALLNQLLTTCPISSTPAGVHLTLPAPSTPLPREKPIPAEKPPTKWQQFAAKKGIQAKKRDDRGKTVYDEATGEWVPKWGYKGKNKEGEGDWLVEVDERKERESGEPGDKRKEGREERRERVKRGERRMRANERRAGKAGGG